MRKSIALVLVAFTLFIVAFLCSCDTGQGESTVLPASVDILKIGKADCIVINTGTKIVMIDTGEKENVVNIREYMAEQGYNKVDTLILTHFDKDHIGGAADIIDQYGVDTVIESTASSDSEEFHEYHQVLNSKGKSAMRLSEDYTFQSDDCAFYINVPRQKKYESKKDNNSSLVVKMELRDTKFLFCGDAEELRATEIIDTCAGKYSFVKLPYHGNYLENYGEFLNSIKTENAAITDSKKNPADTRTLDLLSEHGINVYETRYGTVHAETDGEKITVSQ